MVAAAGGMGRGVGGGVKPRGRGEVSFPLRLRHGWRIALASISAAASSTPPGEPNATMPPSAAVPDLAKNLCHLITVGTTPPGMHDSVVAALVDDLKGSKPRMVVVLATEDSRPNAERLLAELGVAKGARRVRILQSAQSLDEAYMATNEEIERLLEEGAKAEEIMLHYTAGTKVMSAGAVLAALNNDIRSLRYLYSQGPRQKSAPVTTSTRTVLGDRQLRLAKRLIIELRFASALEAINGMRGSLLSERQTTVCRLLGEVAAAYQDWERFRYVDFLKRYRAIEADLKANRAMRTFLLEKQVLEAVAAIAEGCQRDGDYTAELIIDLVNNAIRRLAEGNADDALIRLHRAAELYAQSVLKADFGIRTDDVEIRQVPPRSRASFEAERRMDDMKIKLGLRKSYELLEVLGHPVGKAYREHTRLREVLDARRDLMLAHGTRPASPQLATDFLNEMEDLILIRLKTLWERLDEFQFPWIHNRQILGTARRDKTPTPQELVDAAGELKAPKKASKPKPKAKVKAKGPAKIKAKKRPAR